MASSPSDGGISHGKQEIQAFPCSDEQSLPIKEKIDYKLNKRKCGLLLLWSLQDRQERKFYLLASCHRGIDLISRQQFIIGGDLEQLFNK